MNIILLKVGLGILISLASVAIVIVACFVIGYIVDYFDMKAIAKERRKSWYEKE